MNPPQVFEILSETEPFFTVSSSRKYRVTQMRKEDKLRFWEEGREFVEQMLKAVGSDSFNSVLDYGCGIGRLLRWMVPHAIQSHGVDITPALLERAALECPDATLHHYDRWLTSPPRVEFCYSAIVFQHIPEPQGLAILANLLNHTEKACALHIVVGDRRRRSLRLLFRLSFAPVFAGLSNWLRGRSWSEPRIPMFCWDIKNVRAVFDRTGFDLELHQVSGCVESFWENYLFVGRRRNQTNQAMAIAQAGAND
jgi:SAM-dependent methyltransferase